LFLISISLFVVSSDRSIWLKEENNAAWREVNAYCMLRTILESKDHANNISAPIIDDIPIPLHTQKMKGTLIDYDHDIYRQLPSAAVDAAWDSLMDHGFTYVTEAQALKMGWDVPTTAKLPASLSPGPDTYYIGETDMLHKLHCLNMVRKEVFFDYYWGERYPDGPNERHMIHTSHCLYVIMQSLMCDAHTDLIPSVYLDDYAWPVPDFEINRKCGNFEGVREWEREHTVSYNETTVQLTEKPPGQKSRPMTAEFRRLMQVGT
jgi:hypothetical protein